MRSYLDKIVGNVVCFQGATISSVHALFSPETVLNDTLNSFFQRSRQPSDALKFSTFIFSANSMALVLKTRVETATSLLRTTRNHLKIAWSKFAKVPCLNRWRFGLLLFFMASEILSLFFSQVDKVSLVYSTLQRLATLFFYFPLPLMCYTNLWWTLYSTCVYQTMNQNESCK